MFEKQEDQSATCEYYLMLKYELKALNRIDFK